jgi:hypothetical protein
MFNEKVYEQMHTSKVFESQLQKVCKMSTLSLHELLEKFKDKTSLCCSATTLSSKLKGFRKLKIISWPSLPPKKMTRQHKGAKMMS